MKYFCWTSFKRFSWKLSRKAYVHQCFRCAVACCGKTESYTGSQQLKEFLSELEPNSTKFCNQYIWSNMSNSTTSTPDGDLVQCLCPLLQDVEANPYPSESTTDLIGQIETGRWKGDVAQIDIWYLIFIKLNRNIRCLKATVSSKI